MVDFITTVTRIGREINRTNLVDDIKAALNDAITEAASERFFFNEMNGTTFPTVNGTEYYSDLGFTEIDAMYYFQGGTRYNVIFESQLAADDRAEGNPISGPQLYKCARYAGKLRLYPIPSSIVTIYLDGYGKLTPNPLANDADTNAWLTDGELYIRALTKRNVFRDRVRDFSEATVFDGVAADYRRTLVDASTLRNTGNIRATTF